MNQNNTRPTLGVFAYFALCIALASYFTFAAVQGDFGVFKRAEVQAEALTLHTQLLILTDGISVLENKTERLSDTFLDLDLLDQQARDVLGLVRADEVVVQ